MLSTIKAKLIFSFVLVNILILGSTGLNYFNSHSSSEAFTEYRQMARTSVNLGLVRAEMMDLRMAMKNFILNDSDENKSKVENVYSVLDKLIDETKDINNVESIEQQLNIIKSKSADYFTGSQAVFKHMAERDYLVHEVLDKNGPLIENNLSGILQTAILYEFFSEVTLSANAVRSLLLARLLGAKFIQSNQKEDLDNALVELAKAREYSVTLSENLDSSMNASALSDAIKLMDEYRDGLQQLYAVISERNEVILNQLDVIGPEVAQITSDIQAEAKARQDVLGPQIEAQNENALNISLLVSLIIVIIGIVVAVFMPRFIGKGIDSIKETLTNIRQTGDFSIRADDKRQDEIGEISRELNVTLSAIQGALREANSVVSSLAAGDFSKRIDAQLRGDLGVLKEGINDSVTSIAHTMNEIDTVMTAMSDGHFNVQVHNDAQGQFGVIMSKTAETLDDLNEIISDISQTMDAMQKGEFGARVSSQAPGELGRLKDNVNTSLQSLELAIKDITRLVVAQSEGDLTHKIESQYFGQLDTLKQAINSSVARLSDVVAQALNATHIVAGAADEVAKGSLDLSDRVQQQASAIEETSATMDEMNSVVEGNSRNASEAANVAITVKDKANQGVTVMQDTIHAMSAIQESSHKIADIVNLIDGIAFQTNLLALNAAVEAARAGEHGRGFAVVAGEVRSLAQKSAEAAKDIKSLIEESVSRIDQGSSLATRSGEMLNEINAEIDEFTRMIEDIAQGSREQAQGVSQVHSAITQIDSVTQQNAALVEETSAAAASMTEQSDILRSDMGFFKIDQSLLRNASMRTTSSPTTHSAPAAKKVATPMVASKAKAVSPAPAKPTAAPKAAAPKLSSPAQVKHNDDEWDEF